MSTNFYWRDKPCGHCGRYEEIHVGKSSGGWSFGFRAWPHRLMNEEYPDWGHDPWSPFGFPVVSRADWAKVFAERPGELWDEYGRQVEDPLAWLDELTPPDATKRRWENGHMGPHWHRDPDQEWRDPEGFRFSAREFS